jgi:RNA methyltransferase, TrmH family
VKISERRCGARGLRAKEDGPPRATLDACDAVITIPGAGQMQSLNVSASAAIFLYAMRHVR